MKNALTILALFAMALSFSQAKNLNGTISERNLIVSNMAVSITVDSAEELEKTFKISDIEDFMQSLSENESISIEIVCNTKQDNANMNKSVTYKVNANNRGDFLKYATKIRNAALAFYNN
jgi:hypothetical protein